MRFLKLIIISFFILFLFITFIGLLLPSKVLVSRAIEIQSTKNKIINYTNNFYGWKNWVEPFKDLTIKDSNEVSAEHFKVKILIKDSLKTEGIWQGVKGNNQNFAIQVIYLESNKTLVQWQFEEKIKWFPWARFTSMINDKVIGSALEKNLANLKSQIEK